MKPNFQNCIYGFFLLLFAGAVNAQNVDEKKLLEEVINMKDQAQSGQASPFLQKALQECYQASFSNQKAVAFYIKTMKESEFSGRGQTVAQFQEWQKKNAKMLQNPDFQSAVRLHLIYFCISLKKAAGVSNVDLLNDLIAYTDSVGMSSDGTRKHALLRQPVTRGFFAKRYTLDTLLVQQLKAKEWEAVPANIEAIGNKVIFPELIKNKDARVIQYLDKRLKQENDIAMASRDAITINNFNHVKKPEILWQRAETLLLVGQRNQALLEMRQVVANWPQHPKREEWLNALQSAITNPTEGTIFR